MSYNTLGFGDTRGFDRYGRRGPIFRLAEEAGLDPFRSRSVLDTEGAYAELQDRFYPDAWMFSVGQDQEPVTSYTVRCANPAELALAYTLRPKGINARIILEEPQSTDQIIQK